MWYVVDENNLKKVFGSNVRKYRLRKRMTQEELAEQLHVSVVFLSQLENGIYGVRFDNIAVIASVLEIEPFYLFLPSTVIFDA